MFNPIFTGKLIRLAAPLPEDAETLAVWTRDDGYMRDVDDDPVRPHAPDPGSLGKGDDFYFHVRTRQDDTLIGFVALFNLKWRNQTAELAIGIGDPLYRGRGYGSDALAVLLAYAFDELGLFYVGLAVMDYNQAAIKAYERAGFVREGTRRQVIWRAGQRYDLHCYGLLREEWAARQESSE